MSSAIKTPAFQAKASNILNEDNSSIYSGGEWSFKNASAVARVTIKDDGNCIVTTTGANYITAGGTGGFLVQDADTGGRGLITLRASSGNFQGLQFSNLSGTQTGFGFLSSSTSQVGHVSDAGAWTLGPTGFTGTHLINGTIRTADLVATRTFPTTISPTKFNTEISVPNTNVFTSVLTLTELDATPTVGQIKGQNSVSGFIVIHSDFGNAAIEALIGFTYKGFYGFTALNIISAYGYNASIQISGKSIQIRQAGLSTTPVSVSIFSIH